MTGPPRILGVGTAVPPHRITQNQAREASRSLFAGLPRGFDRLATVFDRTGIEHRNFCVAPDWFADDHPFDERNGLYQCWATRLGERAARQALCRAGVDPSELGSIVFVSTTGLATPSLDARLMARLGLPARHTHRQAVFGRGCSGGAVGLAQAADRCRLDPHRPVLLVVVELCSLTYRHGDRSRTNLVAAALFGDGAAAVVLGAGDPDAARPQVVGADGITWPDTEDLMGWRFGSDGLSVTLSAGIPELVGREFRPSFDEACTHLGIDPRSVDHHLVHPGSALVLDAAEEALGLGPEALRLSRDVLRDHGNMSAATVLFILGRFVAEGGGKPGDLVVMSALGPGFSADHVVLRC